MELDETWAFVGVVRAGSFTAASRVLEVPKSTLSRQVTRLEERLGVRLLQRTTRKLSLTDAGARFYASCRPAIEMLVAAEHALSAEGEVPRGELRVAVPFDFARDWLAPVLGTFRCRYPEVALRVDVSPRRVDLVAEGYDVAIRGGMLDDSSLVARKLADSELVFCASPDYLERHPAPRALSELSEHTVALFTAPPGGWQLLGPGGIERLDMRGWLRINEWGSLRQVAVDGAAVVLSEIHSVAADLQAGRLRRVLPEHGMGGAGLYAVFPSGRHMPAKLRVFIDFLLEVLPATGPGALGVGA